MSKYFTKIVLQMTDTIGEYIPVSKIAVDYDGPWELCGGGQSDPVQQEQEQSQASFDNTLQQIFQQQYSSQQSQLNYLKGQLQPQLAAGGQGYTPAQLAAQRTSATDTNSQQFENAQAALNNQATQASGGSKLTGVSGALTQQEAGLLNAEAQTQASSQNQITQTNANLQQSNYWNAINALNGVAAEENPQSYASSATSAAGASAGAANANTAHIQATTSPILGALGGAIGGAAGGLFQGAGAAGGFGALFGCWIAASFYGWNALETWVIRLWLHTQAPRWFRTLYMTYGETIARTQLRWIFKPLFNHILETV